MISYMSRIDRDEFQIIERFASSHPVKVGELAVALGLKVTRAPLAPRISGLIQPCDAAPAKFEIKVNKYEVPERQRFTVAHELAHFLLHRKFIGSGIYDSIMYRSNLTSRKETEANQLAADIVMPRDLVRRELQFLGSVHVPGVVETMAAAFGVSVPAMKVRLGVA